MKVLSLFDGISCARVALERVGIPVEEYYASEIDKYAIQVSQKNYPGIIQLGSVTDIKSKVLCLSVVYDTLKQYDSNIQNKLSESEMLYWLNQNFSISAKIGTQITNGDASEFTTVQCIEEIWFSKCGVGDIIKTQNTTKSRGNGKEDDKIIQKPILQCGEWWYVYRGDSRSKEKNIFRTNGEEVKEVIYRKNSSISTKTIQHKRIKNKIIGTDKKSDVETRGKEEILDWSKNEKKWSIEAIRDRETQAYYHIENVSLQLPRWNDNERVTEENWNLLQLHKEMETTVVTSSESIDIFTGTFEIMCGGSPCQDLSIAGKRKGLSGERSGLFYEYVRILNEIKPKYFILENVASMSKEAKQTITDELFGIQPVMINASLVSAQNRKRLFWVGVRNDFYETMGGEQYYTLGISQPEDKGILLKDILEDNVDEKYNINLSDRYGLKGLVFEKSKALTSSMWKGYENDGVSIFAINPYSKQILKNKSRALNTVCHSPTTKNATILFSENKYRKLTPVECERLQGLPDNYTEGISNTQRYKCLGNAFNVDVVAHILSFIK